MKCLYYVAPSLDSAGQISDDLHAAGLDDFFVHVIAKDESGLKKRQIHSANYLETLDVIREGFLGAAVGFVVGLLGATMLNYFGPFGTVPAYVFAIVVAVATLFGAWAGGLIGMENENKKLARFHDDIEAGRYLVLVYTRKAQEDAVRNLMTQRHPEAQFAAADTHFINPFSAVQRRRRADRDRLGDPQEE